MKQTNEPMNERVDKDILFSRTIKAGKRVYYVDVKRDRRDALYLSITESKRVKEGSVDERPVFEKHKIFLYREDMEKFMVAITAAADFAIQNAPMPDYLPASAESEGWSKPEDYFAAAERTEEGETSETAGLSGEKIKIDLDF